MAMTSLRPNMMPFTRWMAESVDLLEQSPAAAPTDKRFAAWVRLQRLVEEAGSAFGFNDPNCSVSLNQPRVQLTLRAFDKQLKACKANIPPGVANGNYRTSTLQG
jgi:hypothetical protein